MCLDIKDFYLAVALEYFEYMKTPLTLFPEWIIKQNNLKWHALNGFVHLEMRRAVWGLPQAGILANKCLRQKCVPFVYYKSTYTPGLWCHKTQPIMFTLMANNFGVKYINKDNVHHEFAIIKNYHARTKDWVGDLYCGIQLEWDYVNPMVVTLMPSYIKKNCKNMGMLCPRGCNHVLTHWSQSNLALKPKPLSPLTHHQS
jgi:hypothetical protein